MGQAPNYSTNNKLKWYDLIIKFTKESGSINILQLLFQIGLGGFLFFTGYTDVRIFFWTYFTFVIPVTLEYIYMLPQFYKIIVSEKFRKIFVTVFIILFASLVFGIIVTGLIINNNIKFDKWIEVIIRISFLINIVAYFIKCIGNNIINNNRGIDE